MTVLKKANQLTWRRHLLTEAGQEGMLFLRERVPSINKGLADEMIFEAGKAEGYKQAIDTISELIAAEQKRDVEFDNP